MSPCDDSSDSARWEQEAVGINVYMHVLLIRHSEVSDAVCLCVGPAIHWRPVLAVALPHVDDTPSPHDPEQGRDGVKNG